MKIMYINNDGAGFADHIEIESGTTVAQLFTTKLPHGRPGDYLIRVNRQSTTSEYTLQEGDRVSITPTKIEGAIFLDRTNQTTGGVWEPENDSTHTTLPAS